jgi:hypothetical protein
MKRARMETIEAVSTTRFIGSPGSRMIRKGTPFLFFLLVLFLFPTAISPSLASGQDSGSGKNKAKADYALISGTVWSADDRPAYGVPVKIRRADDKPKKVRWDLMSDHSGEFAQRVPTGKADYIIWADIKTKKGQPKPETRVHIENDERVDTSLHLPQ